MGNIPNFVKLKYKFAKTRFIMHETYHTLSDLSTGKSRFVFYRVMHPSSLTLRRDKACGNVGFCDDPPSLELWRTAGNLPSRFLPSFFLKSVD